MPKDDIQRCLQDLGRALFSAMASSPEVKDAAQKIRLRGYSLHLVAHDDKGRDEQSAQVELMTRGKAAKEPCFLLDGNDVHFLKSLGIDPTRRGRKRRN